MVTMNVKMVSADYLNTVYHKVIMFHMSVGHDQELTPIDFGVTRSKVKVTATLNVKMQLPAGLFGIIVETFHIS